MAKSLLALHLSGQQAQRSSLTDPSHNRAADLHSRTESMLEQRTRIEDLNLIGWHLIDNWFGLVLIDLGCWFGLVLVDVCLRVRLSLAETD